MSTGDRLELRALLLDAMVGVLDSEKLAPQPIRIDLDLSCDLSVAGRSDALDDTVNYAAVVSTAVACAVRWHHELLESLAYEIGEAVLALDDAVDAVEVTVTKLRPPVPEDLGTVAARLRLVR